MPDSELREALEAKHADDMEQRLEAIRRWAEYITSEPASVWGPQQNAIVNGQLEAAQAAACDAEHRQRVAERTDAMLEAVTDDE